MIRSIKQIGAIWRQEADDRVELVIGACVFGRSPFFPLWSVIVMRLSLGSNIVVQLWR